MKRRLLSLLLVMAMLLSMVPFQAFAKEADEAPALLEETEEIVSEPTEETIADPTEDTVPDTTEETVPETTEEIIPETTEETVPETTEETVPETTEEIIPEIMEEIVPETTEAKDPLPLMILEGMDGGYDEDGHMPAKSIRANQTFQLQARLTEGSEINEGLTWHLDGNSKYADCPPFSVATDGTVTFNTAFDFDETGTSASGAWATVVARQVVKEGEEKTVADSPAVISMFPELEMRMVIGDPTSVEDSQPIDGSFTINIADGAFDIGAYPCDYGPFGGSTLKITDKSKVVSADKKIEHVEGYFDNEYYTITPKKTGSFTITATAKDDPNVTVSATIKVVKAPKTIGIKVPASARIIEDEGVKGVVMTAGQKLALSTDIPKDATDKAVTWEILGGGYFGGYSLDGVEMPDGATASGEDWSAVASIDSKGVLRTNAGVTPESCVIWVRAALTSSIDEEGKPKVYDDLPVLIQPPVESFWVNVSWGLEAAPAPDEESAEGAVNRKDNDPRYREIGNGPFELYAGGFQPQIPADGVKWSIKVSKNVADWKETEDNTIIVTPKAPGKLTYTATAKDGSGAKYSGIVEIYGYHRDVEITSAPTTMTAGDKPVAIAAKAYYDDYQDFPIAKPTIWWDLMEAVEVDEDQATDPWGELIDGYFCYEEQYYRGEYTDAATIKGGKLTLGRITKNTKLLLVANCPGRSVYDSDSENWISSDVKDYVFIDVKPANEKALVLAYDYGDYYYPIETDWYHWNVLGGDERIRPVWMDNDGNVLEDLPTDFTYKVSGSACSYDKATGTLTFKKIGTSKLTVSCGGQSVTGEFRCVIPNNTITINGKDENNVITVVGGKSLSLKATGWYDSKTKATTQKFGWSIDDEAFDDKYYEDVYDYCWINWSTGKLTTYPVEEDYYVTVTAECYGEWMSGLLGEENCPSDTVTIHIIPEKTQYRSYAYVNGYNGYFYLTGEDQTLQPGDDFEYWVESYGRYVPSSGTDVISSNPKIAQVVKDAEGNVTGIKIPKYAKPGKVTITVKGQVLDGAEWVDEFWDEHGALIDGHWEGGEWIDAPSAKFTLNVVKPVTDIKLSRPTNKDGSFVPAYVGKSLKLTAKVNSDATNKKLNWGVCYYNGDPEGEFDWELDGDKLEELNWNDNTTVKNGVLKIDKSWYTHGRCYAVFASSQDGNYMSDPIFIQAYGMTGAINIASVGYWPDGERGEYVEYLNNRTVTIKQGEPLEFGALVYDVNGDYGANPDVTWTISGKKNIVEKRYDGMHEEEEIDVLRLKGLNPGTVTIKATAKDGSRKTATFKLVVSNETYEK